MEISPEHPRYRSLITRERLSTAVEEGVVTPTGMISHGRGEAFDYLLGEKSTVEAEQAERVAAAYLLRARNPILCVNGNVAALVGQEIVTLAEIIPAQIEVNLFHRSPERMEKVISHMEKCGAKQVLGRHPDAQIVGISSTRSQCSKEGIFDSDVILVPIEDGDRAQALVNMGKTVIAIDLNPLSRTSRSATVSIVDEALRAIANITQYVKIMKGNEKLISNTIKHFSNEDNLKATVVRICQSLMAGFDESKEKI